MTVAENRQELRDEILTLSQSLLDADIQNANESEVFTLLDSITDVYIQIKQFVQRYNEVRISIFPNVRFH